jgi:hypothetical protein
MCNLTRDSFKGAPPLYTLDMLTLILTLLLQKALQASIIQQAQPSALLPAIRVQVDCTIPQQCLQPIVPGNSLALKATFNLTVENVHWLVYSNNSLILDKPTMPNPANSSEFEFQNATAGTMAFKVGFIARNGNSTVAMSVNGPVIKVEPRVVVIPANSSERMLPWLYLLILLL